MDTFRLAVEASSSSSSSSSDSDSSTSVEFPTKEGEYWVRHFDKQVGVRVKRFWFWLYLENWNGKVWE